MTSLNVEAIAKPVVVIPDIGGAGNTHFLSKDCIDWKKDFIKWLQAPDYLDNMLDDFLDDSDEEPKTLPKNAKAFKIKRKKGKRSSE